MGYSRKSSAGTARPSPVQSTSDGASSPAKAKTKSIWQMQIGGAKKRTTMKRVEVLLFTSELADLLEAGMTLGQALSALARQANEESGQKYVCSDLCERIVRGESFSDALAQHPGTFEPLFANMVRAAEASGAMVEVLRRLADHYERSDAMRAKIKAAMMYPAVVFVFGVIAVIFALIYIIPMFERVFASMGAALPLPTRMLNGLINYGWLMAIGLALAIIQFRRWKKTEKGRLTVDGWKLKAPLIKGIVACGAYSALAYTLKTLLTNGVDVLHALKIAQETCGNAVIAAALADARRHVTDGTSISGPLAASGVFPRMMTDMLAIGEQAGDMPSSLEHIGRRYEKDMDRNIVSFTNALEPLLIVAIAGVVGFVAISILMAVFEVSSTLG